MYLTCMVRNVFASVFYVHCTVSVVRSRCKKTKHTKNPSNYYYLKYFEINPY